MSPALPPAFVSRMHAQLGEEADAYFAALERPYLRGLRLNPQKPVSGAALEAVRLLRSDPTIMQRLQRNIKLFVSEAHKRGLDTCLAGDSAIIPILIGNDSDAFELSVALGHKGVFVPPAVYPAVPRNSARLRFCVISEHKPEQIIHALDTLMETADEMGINIRKREEK